LYIYDVIKLNMAGLGARTLYLGGNYLSAPTHTQKGGFI